MKESASSLGKGYIHVYTGNGKGKTTASVGVVVRAVSAGLRVFVGQFMKSAPTGEHQFYNNNDVEYHQFGTGRFMKGEPTDEDYRRAKEGWILCRDVISSGGYDLVVLDELNLVLHYNLIDVEEVLATLLSRPKGVEVIITGRNAVQKIVDIADLVTEMREIKHYYNQHVPARKGIES